MKLVSVIVTNYNGKEYLKLCLDSLLEQTYTNVEIILSDDASSDDSVEFVKEFFPQVKITANETNKGLSITSNNGAEIARGDYLLFLNNDTIILPDMIEKLVTALELNCEAGVGYPVQLPYDRKYDSGWHNLKKRFFSACGVDIYGNPCVALSEDKVFYPDAAIFIKHSVFNEIGEFDSDFFLYGEDVDICWRVHLLGYKVAYVDKARFYHDSHCSQIEHGKVMTTIRRRALVERQVINMMLKYYTTNTLLFFILPKFIILFVLEAFFFLLVRLKYKIFSRVYVQAVLWNIRNWPKTKMKRSAIQKIRRINDRSIMKSMYNGYAKLDGVRRMGIPVIK